MRKRTTEYVSDKNIRLSDIEIEIKIRCSAQGNENQNIYLTSAL